MRIVQPTLGEVSFYSLLNNIVESFLNENKKLLQSIRTKYKDINF